jgi:hypothetical protein
VTAGTAKDAWAVAALKVVEMELFQLQKQQELQHRRHCNKLEQYQLWGPTMDLDTWMLKDCD